MSLQKERVPGSVALTFPSPVRRSKPLRWLPLTELGPGTPNPDKSFEQTHSMWAVLSTSTPSVDRVSKAPGLIQGSSFVAPRGIRVIPPAARLLTYSVPSEDAVILSG